jgi:anti-anti-sigma factor
MKFEIETEERYTAIKLLEEKLDTRVAPALKSEFVLLSANGTRNILLDLSAVSYSDSSGLGAILMANRICNDAGGIMVLCGVSENVMRVIKMSMLDSVLTIVPTVAEARDAIFMNDLESEIEDELSDEGNEPEIQ